jgi:hypothetical protein
MKIVEKHPRNSAGFCGGGQGLSWAVESKKEEPTYYYERITARYMKGMGQECYGLDDRGSIPSRGRDFPRCYHVQTDSGYRKLKQPGRKVECMKLCLHFPIRLHGVVLNEAKGYFTLYIYFT